MRTVTAAAASGCDVQAFVSCAGVSSSTYTSGCCTDVQNAEGLSGCTNGYDDCYFCGIGGAACFTLDPAVEAQCLADHGCSALSLTLPLRSCHLLLLQHNQHQYSSFTSPEMSGHMTQTRVNHDSWPPSLHMSPSLHMVFASTILARRLILSSHTI